MEYRSPLDSVLSFISGLPQGHDKPVKHALYNALALFALVICCAGAYALYVILGPFIKPLIWALLVGSVLHPFKCSLAKRFRSWFQTMEESNTPIFIGIFIVPINILNDISEFVGSKSLKYLKYIIGFAIVIPLLHVIYYYTPRLLICTVWKLASYNHFLMSFIINNATITSISLVLIGYITLTVCLWSPENNRKFHYASIGIWLLLLCFVANQFGSSFQTPVFIAMQIILLSGFVYEVYDLHEDMIAEGHQVTFMQSLMSAFNSELTCKHKKEEPKVEHVEETHDQSQVRKSVSPSKLKSSSTFEEAATKLQDNLKLGTEKKDPWSLELFERKDKNLSKLETIKDSEISEINVDVKITPKTVSPPILQTSNKDNATQVAGVVSRKVLPSNIKLRRSLSQPQVPTYSSSSLFKFLRPLESNRLAGGISKTNQPVSGDTSGFFLYTLLWCCVIMSVWKNLMLLPILIIPILIYVIKYVGKYLGLWNWLFTYWIKMNNALSNWCAERYDALVPIPVRGLYKVIDKVNYKVKQSLQDSIDTVASSMVIFGLLIFVICASIFIAIQVYTEAIMLVQMTSNVINQTVVHNPELRQLLPPSFDDTVDSVLDNAYQYGREIISNLVKRMMNGVDAAKSARLEKQVLEVWDRLYQAWMSSDDSQGPKVTSAAVQSSWNAFIDDIQKTPEMFNLQGITEFVKQNIGTFMTLLESVWSILKGNISLILSSTSGFISILLGGGTVVLNFILNAIVFLTTLFYLLSASGELYKPVELLTNVSSSGSRFGLAFEAAVNGVFLATFKMAAFYGMWTWFIHNLFGLQIVYVPSALAAILGAIPFLGTYWACVPAVLDLWLAQGKSVQAVMFALFQFVPTSVVDTTIYNEIQGGGHPYLTGLAIAGGIFCLGVEGAIIGPLLLCALYVAIDLSSSFFKDSPSDEPINIPTLSR